MKKAVLLVITVLFGACTVGPNYRRPVAPVPPNYKEPPPPGFKESPGSQANWEQAKPMEGVVRGKWWETYNDPALNALEEQVAISNQNVLLAEAQFREARATIKIARSALFPAVTVGAGVTTSSGSSSLRPGQVSTAGITAASTGVNQFYTLPFDLTWQLDLWGGIRRALAAATNTAQASEAQLENARLSFQATLAEDYFSLHGLDARKKILDDSTKLFEQFLDLTNFRFQNGVASEADVALAQTQLETTRAQAIDVGVQRAEFEHAIAILIGKPPAELSIPELAWNTPPPAVPVGVPSQLLERRPDIAAAEREVAAANERIGVAKAAYYPTLSLTGSAGLESSMISTLLSWPSRFWSLGPQLTETILDFGSRRGALQETEATYDATVATYRQTVLTAFQQVEDGLSSLRILEQESGAQSQAVEAAQHSLDVSTDQYKNGVADYLQVITAQTTLLTNQVTLVGILTNRMVASVSLIEALGGGWDASQLSSYEELKKTTPQSKQPAPANSK